MKIAREMRLTGIAHYQDITGNCSVRSILERVDRALEADGFGDEEEGFHYSGTLYRVTVTVQDLT